MFRLFVCVPLWLHFNKFISVMELMAPVADAGRHPPSIYQG